MHRFVLLCLLAGTVCAADVAVTIEKPWSRATAPSAANGAIFMSLKNASDVDVRVIGVASRVAEHVELHGHRSVGQGVEMYRLESLVIPAKGRVDLKPGGMHVMLLGLKAPLVEESTITLELTLDGSATPLSVAVPVLAIAAMGPEADEKECCAPER